LDARIGEARARAVKLEHYIEMAREFGGHGVDVSESPQREGTNEPRQRAPQGGMSGRAVQECIAIIRERGQPVHTNELHRLIAERGVTLGGKNPAQALSGYLSRTPGLVADRSRGWSLAEWGADLSSVGPDPIEPHPSGMAA
jgi:hypothetical protein